MYGSSSQIPILYEAVAVSDVAAGLIVICLLLAFASHDISFKSCGLLQYRRLCEKLFMMAASKPFFAHLMLCCACCKFATEVLRAA